MTESPWLTPAQAAKYLNDVFQPRMIQTACREGRLKHVRPGGNRILIRRDWLDEWCLRSVEGGTENVVQEMHSHGARP